MFTVGDFRVSAFALGTCGMLMPAVRAVHWLTSDARNVGRSAFFVRAYRVLAYAARAPGVEVLVLSLFSRWSSR